LGGAAAALCGSGVGINWLWVLVRHVHRARKRSMSLKTLFWSNGIKARHTGPFLFSEARRAGRN